MKKRLFLLIIVIAIISFFAFSGIARQISVGQIKEYINSFGPLAPLIYIIMFTLVPLTLFPDSILAISGGAVFGVYLGALYTIIGAVLGATLSFCISRYLGRSFAEKLIRHKAEWFDEGVEDRGFIIILMLRLIPLVPFDIISYGAGLSKIKYMDFMFATFIGIIPGVFIYSNLGDKALNIMSIEFWLAVGMLVSLFAVSYVLKKKYTLKKIQGSVEKR